MPDEQYILQIYEKYGDALYRLCYFYMKNAQDASDAVQNTLVKLMEYQGTFESEIHAKNWLFKVGANECKMLLRHWWRRMINIDTVLEYSDQEWNYSQNPVLIQVLELPRKYRVPLYMYYYEGYSTAEIGSLLHINESTIRSQLRRGRAMLKDALEGEWETETPGNKKESGGFV